MGTYALAWHAYKNFEVLCEDEGLGMRLHVSSMFFSLLFSDIAGAQKAVEQESIKLKVAVMTVRVSEKIPEEMGPSLTTALSEELDKTGAFDSLSTEDVKNMLGFEKFKSLVGCETENTSCLAEIGGALGAHFLVVGSVVLIEQIYLIQIQLIQIAKSKAVNRVSREYQGGPVGLARDIRVAAKLLVRDVLAERSGLLEISTTEEGATVKIDDAIRGVTPLDAPVSLSQGVHTLEIEKEGFIRYGRDITILKDSTTSVNARLLPSEEFIASYRKEIARWRSAAWIASGVGAAGLTASLITFLLGSSRSDELNADKETFNAQSVRPQSEFDELQRRERQLGTLDSVTLTAALVGLVGASASVALFTMGPDPNRYASTPKSKPIQAPDSKSGAQVLLTLGEIFLVYSF